MSTRCWTRFLPPDCALIAEPSGPPGSQDRRSPWPTPPRRAAEDVAAEQVAPLQSKSLAWWPSPTPSRCARGSIGSLPGATPSSLCCSMQSRACRASRRPSQHPQHPASSSRTGNRAYRASRNRRQKGPDRAACLHSAYAGRRPTRASTLLRHSPRPRHRRTSTSAYRLLRNHLVI